MSIILIFDLNRLLLVNVDTAQSINRYLKLIKVNHNISCDYQLLSKLVFEFDFYLKTISRRKGLEATVSISISKLLTSAQKVLCHF